MKMYEEVEVQPHAFLIWALDEVLSGQHHAQVGVPSEKSPLLTTG
jgi:hypothetical protein